MKARVEASILARALKTVLPAAVTRGASMPIYAGVRLDCDGSTLQLQCTSWDLTITTEVDVDGGEGVSVVPAGLLHKIVSGITGAVTLAGEGTTLSVDGGSVTAELVAYDERGWPQLPVVAGEAVELSDEQCQAIARCLSAAGNDQSRPPLPGVHFIGDHAETCDSYRLARVQLPGADLPDVTIPASAVKLVLDARDGGPVSLAATSERAQFTVGPVTWLTTVYAEGYPDLDRLISNMGDVNETVTLDAALMLERLKQIRSAGIDAPVRLTVNADGVMEMAAVEQGRGSISVSLDVGGQMTGAYGVSAGYLADLVESHGHGEVLLELRDPLKMLSTTNGDIFLAVMPHRGVQ